MWNSVNKQKSQFWVQVFPKPSQILINYMNQVCQVKSHKFPGDFPDISIYPPISYHRCGNLYGFPREGKNICYRSANPSEMSLLARLSQAQLASKDVELEEIPAAWWSSWGMKHILTQRKMVILLDFDDGNNGDFIWFWWDKIVVSWI